MLRPSSVRKQVAQSCPLWKGWWVFWSEGIGQGGGRVSIHPFPSTVPGRKAAATSFSTLPCTGIQWTP